MTEKVPELKSSIKSRSEVKLENKNETFDDVNPSHLISDGEKENKSTTSQRIPPLSATTIPNIKETIDNPAELLHQKMVTRSKISEEEKSATVRKNEPILLNMSFNKKRGGRTKMSTLGEKDFKFEKEESSGIEVLDMHRKIVEEVSKVKFDESITVVEHMPRSTTLSVHFINLKGKANFSYLDNKSKTIEVNLADPTEDEESYSSGGQIYRAFFYQHKLHVFRKQATDKAQVVDFTNLSEIHALTKDIKVETINFELIENEVLDEVDGDGPPSNLPNRTQKELSYLKKVELSQTQLQPRLEGGGREKEGKIIDLRKTKEEPESVSENNEEKPKSRKLDFSIRKNSEAQQLIKIKNVNQSKSVNLLKQALHPKLKPNKSSLKVSVSKEASSIDLTPAAFTEKRKAGQVIPVQPLISEDESDSENDKKRVRFEEEKAS